MDRALRTRLAERLGDQLLAPVRGDEDTTELVVGAGHLRSVVTTLHDDPDLGFRMLVDLAGVDTGDVLQVVYHLWSAYTPDWLRVICDGLPREDPRAPSVTFLWNGAEWAEREAYDMFGIVFEGNRDLRRIYMPLGYRSFPLRKDFLLPDDAPRSPGLGVRHLERPIFAAENRRRPLLRRSPGTGSTVNRSAVADSGERLPSGDPSGHVGP